MWVYTPLMTDEASGSSESVLGTASSNTLSAQVEVITDTSQRVRVVSDGTSGTYSLRTLGWIDTRGKLS
jgi:hypothetical protein